MNKTTLTLSLCIILLSTSFSASAESKKIVKWVDKNGVTHYGDKPPMPEVTTRSAELNNQGVVVKTNDINKTNVEADKINEAQSRKDAALLGSYNSIEEIDIAKERNTKTDQLILDNLNQRLSNLKIAQGKNATQIAGLSKNKKPIPADLTQEKQQIIKDIANTEKQITAKKTDIENIKIRYDGDKARYAELKPRGYALTDIKYKRKNMLELQKWRAEAESRVAYFQSEALRYKRSKASIPQTISDGILSSNRELERANAEIATLETQITANQKAFSK